MILCKENKLKQIVICVTSKVLTVQEGKREKQYETNKSYQWRYMEVLPKSIHTIFSYERLIESGYFSSDKSRLFRRMKYGDMCSTFWTYNDYIVFSKKNFVSYEITTERHQQSHYTLQKLMNELPAEDMIEYLKDNGLNICPIAR